MNHLENVGVCVPQSYNYTHLSAGDLLRAERAREGSEFGQLIANYIKEGKIVPVEITINLLKKVCVRAEAAGALLVLIFTALQLFQSTKPWDPVHINQINQSLQEEFYMRVFVTRKWKNHKLRQKCQ